MRRGVFVTLMRSGALRGGVMRAPYKQPNNEEFNERQPEIRIDYTQHAWAALGHGGRWVFGPTDDEH